MRPSATGAVSRSVSYTYDAFDRRVSKSIDADGAGPNPATVERYVYDRDHILLVFNGNNTLTHRYVYGPELDMALVDERGSSNVRWLLADNQGTIRDLTNNAGVLQNHIRYDSFGNRREQTTPSVNTRFGYTGRELDGETGLYYYRSRYFDPLTGRFLSEDRIGFAGGDANLYRYVSNSPVNFTDPWGLQSTSIWNNDLGIDWGWLLAPFLWGIGKTGETGQTLLRRLQESITQPQHNVIPTKEIPYLRTNDERQLKNQLPKVGKRTRCGCFVAFVPRDKSDPSKYAAQVSGSPFEFAVLTPNGELAIFDGLAPGTANVWETKLYRDSDVNKEGERITQLLIQLLRAIEQGKLPKGKMKEQRQTLENLRRQRDKEQNVAAVCGFEYNYAVASYGLARALSKYFRNMPKVDYREFVP